MRPAELEERARVLVAGDARKNLELIQALLTLGGYEVITASDGEEAQRKIEKEPVALVLLDVMMAKLNGYGLNLTAFGQPC
jgi:two-component system alkaline phosphatase synthesis response regulator PhoP